MYCQTHRIFGPARRGDAWKSVPLQRGGGFGSFLSRLGSKFAPHLKRAVQAPTNVAKKIANSDTAKQMGNLLAEKGVEAATDLIGNAIGGDVSAEANIGNLQKKFVENLSFKKAPPVGFKLKTSQFNRLMKKRFIQKINATFFSFFTIS